jgi:hypothetical protein
MGTQQWSYCWKLGVPTWFVLKYYKQGTKCVQFVEFCMGSCEDRTLVHEAEESRLLEAVARERLVKTQQAVKGLPSAVVTCELWRLAVAL